MTNQLNNVNVQYPLDTKNHIEFNCPVCGKPVGWMDANTGIIYIKAKQLDDCYQKPVRNQDGAS